LPLVAVLQALAVEAVEGYIQALGEVYKLEAVCKLAQVEVEAVEG
jgi:hypothetical protein